MVLQLPLGLALQPLVNYENFVVGDNAATLSVWSDMSEPQVWVWGRRGVGKTHLLHAACHALAAQGEPVAYLPLAEADELSPAVLDGLEQMALVCIDDVEIACGREAWERALFNFYNLARANNVVLRFTSSCPPTAAQIVLPDLRSRFLAGPVFQLRPLSDDDKLKALTKRAKLRGLEFSEEVGRYLLQHYQRDMGALFELLDRLDQFSLAAQRRITVPLVRQYFRSLPGAAAD